jgi:hypothetical protein
MSITDKEKILSKLDGFTDIQIEQMVQQSEVEIANYRFTISNYDKDKMANFGVPHLARLEAFYDALMVDLERRTG